ncbi:MAG TPA: hypothetical protein VL309_07645 [Vicinamibacterales bacterium]|jgi:uncharacterized protein|nr:hypothetical protein [Vicinamibacterales bacterium]
MLLRLLLYVILAAIVARAFWRFMDGLRIGLHGGRGASGVPDRGVQMVRDPVCGTFVVPDHAVSIAVGRERVYFCSAACRDAYRARTA